MFNSPKVLKLMSAEELAAINFVIQLQAAYNYQLSLRREQRPRRRLPPVPKFEESEYEPETQKKVQIAAISQEQAKLEETEVKLEAEAEHHSAHHHHHQHHSMIEEEKSNEQDQKGYILSQMNSMISQNEETETIASPSHSDKSHKSVDLQDKREMKKFKKLESCMIELAKKLEIKDASVLEYGREFLQDIVPNLIELFNKKPFIAIAAAVLIFACYKAEYPMTTKRIIEASEQKESLIIKCFYSIKEVLTQKKNE